MINYDKVIALIISPIVILPFWIASILWCLPVFIIGQPVGSANPSPDSLFVIKNITLFGALLTFVIWRVGKQAWPAKNSTFEIFKIFLDGVIILALIASGILFCAIFGLLAVKFGGEKITYSIFISQIVFSCIIFWTGCFILSFGPLVPTSITFYFVLKREIRAHIRLAQLKLTRYSTSEKRQTLAARQSEPPCTPTAPSPAHPASAPDRSPRHPTTEQ